MRYAEEQTAKIKAALETVNIKKNSVVLDIGCGTGILFDYVANEKTRTVVGVDISRKVLLIAKRRTKNFANVHLIVADADTLPLKRTMFTHIFGVTLLQNMPNPAETLKEIARVTKENAIIIVTAMKKAFTLEDFRKLLRNADFKGMSLKSEGLKCYVVVCMKNVSP